MAHLEVSCNGYLAGWKFQEIPVKMDENGWFSVAKKCWNRSSQIRSKFDDWDNYYHGNDDEDEDDENVRMMRVTRMIRMNDYDDSDKDLVPNF